METKTFGCLFNLLLLTIMVNGSTVAGGQGGKSVLCFFEGMAAVRSLEEGPFTPEDLDISICTHLVYNRANVSEDLEVVPRNNGVDLLENGGKGLYNRTIKLKELKPGLQVFLDVYDKYKHLKQIFGNDTAVSRFARRVADYAQGHGFDGVSFRIFSSQDFKEVTPFLHEELARRGMKLMTIVLRHNLIGHHTIDLTEPLSRHLDLIALGSYWRIHLSQTAVFSSLTVLEEEVEHFRTLGVPTEKLVVIIPALTVAVKLCSRSESAIGSEICGVGDEGAGDKPETIFFSGELTRKMANASEDWVVVRDKETGSLFAHSRSLLWTSFEDPTSVRAKARFIMEKNLAGAAITNVDMEDFKGAFSDGGETFPLTRAAFNALHEVP